MYCTVQHQYSDTVRRYLAAWVTVRYVLSVLLIDSRHSESDRLRSNSQPSARPTRPGKPGQQGYVVLRGLR
jgi:hypothetical protein